MTRTRIIWVLGLVLLAGGLTGRAQSVLGDYHGTALVGDDRMPIEFIQSMDLGLTVSLSEKGDLTGSLSFRRFFRGADGRFAEAQAELGSLVVNDDLTFQATALPIRLTVNGRVVERTVTLVGQFVFPPDGCIPTIEAIYSETIRGLTFGPMTLAGPLSMARRQDTPFDDACLAQ